MDSTVLRFYSIHTGELPPPPPRACFGRDGLVAEIVDNVENSTPVALIGPGGIGKTSVALTVLHHNRIKGRFGDNRRFIRCDRFPASCAHFLAQLSKVVGAGVENPEDLASLRPFLSSKEILIILDNAESVLDPQGTDAQEIYAVVDELCQLRTLSILITSRITTVPPHCKRPGIPTLSMEAACDIFYGIYGGNGRPGIINDLLQCLDFHPLSIMLLATTASRNMWDHGELAKEWEAQRAQVLRTDYNQSLAATIELSLTSPTFRNLGPNARELLGVTAFLPQGINKVNLDWLFPTISDRKNIFDKFCMLSLTHRSDNFITMLAPIREYLRVRDPTSSPLLCVTKDRYFSRLSVDVHPGEPGFGETRWVRSEDINVEHLLDVFVSLDTDSDGVWQACAGFVRHLYWHKQRHTVLRPRIEGLSDDHLSKPECLFELSRLFSSVGNPAEQKRLLVHALILERERRNDRRIARILSYLSNANRTLGLHGEGMQNSKEALEILERLGDTKGQANCLVDMAQLLHEDEQLDAAVEAACRGICLFPEKGQELYVCQSHRALGNIYRSKGERDKAIRHFEVALGIASPFDWDIQLFWTHFSLSLLFFDEDRVDDAYAHLEKAKSHAGENAYNLGRAFLLQAEIRYRQCRLDEATSNALRALEISEKLGATEFLGDCKALFQEIERAVKIRSTSGKSDSAFSEFSGYDDAFRVC